MQGEFCLSPTSSDASGSFPAPLGTESSSGSSLRAVTCRSPFGHCPCQRPPYTNHLSALVEKTGALRVLCFLIQWCQTFISPQKHNTTPRDPAVTAPLHEPISGVSPAPALTPAPCKTSLAEGEEGGRLDTDCPGKVFKAFGVPAWGQEGKYLCMCE